MAVMRGSVRVFTFRMIEARRARDYGQARDGLLPEHRPRFAVERRTSDHPASLSYQRLGTIGLLLVTLLGVGASEIAALADMERYALPWRSLGVSVMRQCPVITGTAELCPHCNHLVTTDNEQILVADLCESDTERFHQVNPCVGTLQRGVKLGVHGV
jgi:hypothetical protein